MRLVRLLRLVAPLAAAAGLAACASISERIAGTMSELPAIGLPADAPQRPVEPAAFPAVHEMPPARMNTVLTDIEQQKLEDDLVAARNAQQISVGITPVAVGKKANAEKTDKTKKPKKSNKTANTDGSKPPTIPASSRSTIY